MSRLLPLFSSSLSLGLARRHYSAQPLRYTKRNWPDIKRATRNSEPTLTPPENLLGKLCGRTISTINHNSTVSFADKNNCPSSSGYGISEKVAYVHLDHRRCMATKKRSKKSIIKEDPDDGRENDEDGDDDDDDVNENPLLVNDSTGDDSSDCKLMDIDVVSLRLDVVAKVGFSTTRAKIEEAFYQGNLFINGEKPEKKSEDLSLGDEIDLVKGVNRENPDEINITRIVIVGLPDKATQQGRYKLKIEKYLNLSIAPHGDN